MRPFLILFFLCISTLSWAQDKKPSAPKKEPQYLHGIYVPEDLEDALNQFNLNWSDSMKASFARVPETVLLQRYAILQEWIMNTWGLWQDSRLAEYFYNLGLYHPEDMSALILIAYHRQRCKEEMKLKELIQKYRDYWKERGKDIPKEVK